MTMHFSRGGAVMVAAIVAALGLTASIAMAQSENVRHRAHPKDLSPALQQQLTDELSNEMEPILGAEEEKKEKGQTYVDLLPQFQYLPTYGPRGQVIVSAKVGGAEYTPGSGAPGKGRATGRIKYLVFTYALQKGKWVEIRKPKWEMEDLGAAAGEKMTQSAERAEEMKAREAAAAARRAQSTRSASPSPTPPSAASQR